MEYLKVSFVTVKKAAAEIGFSARTLKDKANNGEYPPTVIRKIGTSWMIDLEEWDRWHRNH